MRTDSIPQLQTLRLASQPHPFTTIGRLPLWLNNATRFERNGNLTAHTYTCLGAIYLEELLFQKFVDALRVQGQLVTAGRNMPSALLFYYTISVYSMAFVCVYVCVCVYTTRRS